MAEHASEIDIEALHAASEIRQVALSDLKIDRSYQRDPTQTLVDKIAARWDEVSSELLLVSDRGERPDEQQGGLFIVNGQHRSLGARKHGEEYVWARVIDLREFEDPGAIESTFRLRTNVRMSDKPQERFKAQVRAGDPESLAIVKILDRFETEVNEVPTTEAGINAIAGVEKLYRLDDGVLLTEVLQMHKDVYGIVGGRTTSSAAMLAFAWFIIKHSSESDRDRAVEKWNAAGYAALDRRGRTLQSGMGGTLWLNYYRALVDFYNERLHDANKLEWRHKGASSWKGTSNWGRGSD